MVARWYVPHHQSLVSSTMLLLKLSAARYSAQKEKALSWDHALTPHGTKLCDNAFEGINFRHYGIFVDNNEENSNRLVARVTRLGENIMLKGDAGSSKRRMTTDQSLVDVPVEYRTRMEFHATT